MKTICVCTSVHRAWDVRIFEKEILTLLKRHRVIYVAPETDSQPPRIPAGLTYIPLKKTHNRLLRFFRVLFVFRQLFSLRDQVVSYHVHDPELSIALAALKILTGKYCIYDVHENHSAAIRDRFWIPLFLRRLFSAAFSIIEKICTPFFDAVVCVSDEIAQLYPNTDKIVLPNYPSKMHYHSIPRFDQKKPYILLAGGLTRVRGVLPAVQAFVMAELPEEFQLILLGWFESEDLKRTILKILADSDKKNRYQYIPFVPYRESLRYVKESAIGIIPYLDYLNHRFGIPTKIFEFMAAGTPIIYNSLPNYRRLLEPYQLGLSVDCSDIIAISKAMEKLAHNPLLRQKIGEQARQLFLTKFNWEQQENVLLNLYEFPSRCCVFSKVVSCDD